MSIAAMDGYPPSLETRPVSYYSVELPEGVPHDGWNVVDFVNHDAAPVKQGEFVWMEIAIDNA